jgi:mannitol-1-/sugar-/sorbitol-6-phosphatase
LFDFELTCHAVLFDLDGVLVDSEPVVARTWQRWLARHGLEIPDLIRRAHGRRSVDTVREVAPVLNVEEEVEWLAAVELTDAEGLHVLSGAVAAFEFLPDRHRAVVTSGSRALAEFRLQQVRLSLPSVLVGADSVRNGKPAPDGYLLAAERLNVDPRDCVVIEDTPAGIEAGKAAGAKVIAVSTTFPEAALARADVVLPSLAALRIERSQGLVRLARSSSIAPG